MGRPGLRPWKPAATIFAAGRSRHDRYVAQGAVRLSVLSHAGKEAVVAVLDVAHFFGEGCLTGQSQRMATATAMTACTVVVVEKQEMVRQLHAKPAFADRFLRHMLRRNIRSRVNFFINKFRKLGFIEYNGGLKINNSLLTVVLRD